MTMGSHIWDASVVLANYLERIPISGNVVELGAGCGLVGMSIVDHQTLQPDTTTMVLLTDQSSQLPILHSNIQLNKLQSHCKAIELDWCCTDQVMNVKTICNDCIDVIIAADVLYNNKEIEYLLQVIYTLHPVRGVYLAQKDRGDSDTVIKYCQTLFPQWSWDCVADEYQVKIWCVTINKD
jgi:predicted nicotinamide N-methyase